MAVHDDAFAERFALVLQRQVVVVVTPPSTSVSPMIFMATRNLINMVAVGATSGAVLLTLLAAKHF
jgi:hypothetical protein